ncbi:MAG: hypothetical protein HY907_14520 [Deltaproteobacteria bacterium]|nr:hypothetical protein [Deltaproteobacteria bacterium]
MTVLRRGAWWTAVALAALAVPASAAADRSASCTLTVVEAHDGEAAPSMDPKLAPFETLLSVPPFTIFKVFKQLFTTSLTFDSIPQERTVAFPAASLAGLSARITYSGYGEQSGDLVFEVKLSKDAQTLLEPTIRLSGAPLPLVVPWPDPMNVLILIFQCTPGPAAE